ncbi:hypothetical protein KAI56_03725 [Candidatus Parcubacteria bacterium]|nr:hypothetical protein [Candidatus Parcubacteria bacterium]
MPYYLGFNVYDTELEVELAKKISKITGIKNPHDTIHEIRRQQKEITTELNRTERELELYQQQLTKLDYHFETTRRKL